MSDAMRRALEAACRTDPMFGATPGGDADIRRDRAEAIAAFLRALPDWHDIPPGRSVSAAYLNALAAAVEAERE